MPLKTDSPLFCPIPERAIGDRQLSALDIRVLACVAKYDRMSLPKGKGRGCIASHETMAEELDCHPTSLSKSIRTLLATGYLVSERQSDGRLRVYRVDYSEDSWSIGQQSPAPEGRDSWRNGQQSPPRCDEKLNGQHSGRDSWPVGADSWPIGPEIVGRGNPEDADFKGANSDNRKGKERKRSGAGDFDEEESRTRRLRDQALTPLQRDLFRRRIVQTWEPGDDELRNALSRAARISGELIEGFCRGGHGFDDRQLAILRDACVALVP